MVARFTIDGEEVPSEAVARRAMNFGQPVSERQPLAYELSVSMREIPELLDQAQVRTARELQEDAALGDEDEIAAELRVLGWPTLERLAERHTSLLIRYIRTYLVDELLDSVAQTPASSAHYQLNSVDEVELSEDRLIVRGQSYRS